MTRAKTLLCVLAVVAMAWTATPAAAQFDYQLPGPVPSPGLPSNWSDVVYVTAPTGGWIGAGYVENPNEPNSFLVVGYDPALLPDFTPVAANPAAFGSPTALLEANGSLSDVYGVAFDPTQGGYVLAFLSDNDLFGGPDPAAVLNYFGVTLDYFNATNSLPELPGVAWDATQYLDPGLAANGYTASFQSDGIPEPISLIVWSVLGIGGGLGVIRRRRAR